MLLAGLGPVWGQGDSFETLRSQFNSPGAHYGSAPLWVWNTKVSRTDIDSMLAAFKKNSFGGVFVHPRPGLITEYLSEEWLDDYAYTVKKGKELGLDVWIYDENSYPSGFAGGHVPDEMPSSYDQGQMLHLTKTTLLPDTADRLFLCVVEDQGIFKDITGDLAGHRGRTGNYYLFSKAYYGRSPWYGGFSYVDLMVKGVTEKFIDVTMKGYERRFGAEFGKTVRGIFSDEANIETQGSGNIRWTPDLFSTFRQKWGYDLAAQLPSLFEDKGDWKKVRHNYYQTLLDLFVDRWSKPFAAYAASKDLEWTGHYWEHSWPDPDNGPDNMAMYVYPQRPGIDMLFNQFDEVSKGAQFGNIRSVKELSSVANQLGKKRTLSETYGGGGWDLSFKDMKRLGDWEFVLGVNTLNQHLAHMTLGGARKYDYPQSFSYHNPWWPFYGSLNRHFTRLTYALTQGEERNDILVLEPTTSAWMHFRHDGSDKRFSTIGDGFQAFVTRLQKAGVEYDLGSEYIIRERGRVAAGKFIVGGRSYKTVVIPPGMENVDQATLKLLLQLASQGGRILQFEKIQQVDGADDGGAESFNAMKGGRMELGLLDDAVIKKYFLNEDLAISQDNVTGDLFHMRRQLKDGQILFLANSDLVAPSKARVSIKGKRVLLLETFTGAIAEYPATAAGGMVSFDCVVPPAGSILLFIAEKESPGYPKWRPTSGRKESVLTASETTVIRPKKNSIMIDFCDVRIGDTLLTDKHVFDAADTVYKHFGFRDGNPWNTSVQFRKNIIDRDQFADGSSFGVTYHFSVGDGLDTRSLEAVVERCKQWTITINGQTVQAEDGKWWLDKSFGVVKIGSYVRAGENSLQLSTRRMSVYDEIEPIYILGDFNLVTAVKGWSLVPPAPLQIGSWKAQGLPMYGEGISYQKELTWKGGKESAGKDGEKSASKDGKELTWKGGANRVWVQLGKWNGTVAAVTVNGKQAGIIACEPYRSDITKFLVQGKNTIRVTVIGSLKNLLGPHHKKPRPGLASPWHWRNINSYPAGKDYDTYDYGLMEDFQVIAEGK